MMADSMMCGSRKTVKFGHWSTMRMNLDGEILIAQSVLKATFRSLEDKEPQRIQRVH